MILEYLLLRARLFFKDTEGASAIEYAIVVAMVAVVAVVFIAPVGAEVRTIFNNVLVALGGSAVNAPAP
ncbi:Flp family type IVb pilin [Pseudomonas prosekii]|uniref:Flp family type IVb pilin n=1 Tax=Pseudomonas prosekii TaxID=1148509 RepID=UPI000D60C1E8|nr:Flp family type IVb pilin [Pseudomonas prosekii]PWE38519.1 Flp family type IVb pilin [Pseudomonas prosekii]